MRAAFVVMLALAACRETPRVTASQAPSSSREAGEVARVEMAGAEVPPRSGRTLPVERAADVLPEAGRLIDLAVPGFDDAVVAVPRDGTPPHRLIVAAHANWDRPDWECGYWRRLFPDSFLLCPRGVLRDDAPADDPRFTYENDETLEREVEAGLAALETRFPERFDSATMLWVGLSRGAFLGAIVAAREPARYPRMILVEGGHDPWAGAAKAYAEGGGRRVLFVCGQGACTVAARRAARSLEHFGVGARVVEVAGMGHGLNHDADAHIEAARDWLFEW